MPLSVWIFKHPRRLLQLKEGDEKELVPDVEDEKVEKKDKKSHDKVGIVC